MPGANGRESIDEGWVISRPPDLVFFFGGGVAWRCGGWGTQRRTRPCPPLRPCRADMQIGGVWIRGNCGSGWCWVRKIEHMMCFRWLPADAAGPTHTNSELRGVATKSPASRPRPRLAGAADNTVGSHISRQTMRMSHGLERWKLDSQENPAFSFFRRPTSCSTLAHRSIVSPIFFHLSHFSNTTQPN